MIWFLVVEYYIDGIYYNSKYVKTGQPVLPHENKLVGLCLYKNINWVDTTRTVTPTCKKQSISTRLPQCQSTFSCSSIISNISYISYNAKMFSERRTGTLPPIEVPPLL